jgi:hypothetical protein
MQGLVGPAQLTCLAACIPMCLSGCCNRHIMLHITELLPHTLY